MLRYIAGRLVQAVVIVAIVATITFALIHIAPGDPFSAVLDNPNVNERVRETLRAQYGLDRPLPEQFVRYIGQLARGELGWSFSHDRPVREVLAQALPNTLLLMTIALVGQLRTRHSHRADSGRPPRNRDGQRPRRNLALLLLHA